MYLVGNVHQEHVKKAPNIQLAGKVQDMACDGLGIASIVRDRMSRRITASMKMTSKNDSLCNNKNDGDHTLPTQKRQR